MKLINTVAIVDGASTSAYLAPAFRSYGIKCVHVLSSESLPDRLKVQIIHTDYIRSVVYQGDISVLANMLKDLQIDVVLPGGGSGIELASELADALDVPYKNPGHLAKARRHKYEQIEILHRSGLLTPKQYQSDQVAGIVEMDTHSSDPAGRGETYTRSRCKRSKGMPHPLSDPGGF